MIARVATPLRAAAAARAACALRRGPILGVLLLTCGGGTPETDAGGDAPRDRDADLLDVGLADVALPVDCPLENPASKQLRCAASPDVECCYERGDEPADYCRCDPEVESGVWVCFHTDCFPADAGPCAKDVWECPAP